MTRFAWIVTVPLALLVILFALMNRQEVSLSLWPFPWDVTAPLFLFTLGAIVVGFFFGAFAAWLSGRTTRQKLRVASRALAEARDELAHAKRQSREAQSRSGQNQLPTALPPAA